MKDQSSGPLGRKLPLESLYLRHIRPLTRSTQQHNLNMDTGGDPGRGRLTDHHSEGHGYVQMKYTFINNNNNKSDDQT